MKVSIVIRIESETKKALIKLAQADRRTLSDYLRLLLEDKINQAKKK